MCSSNAGDLGSTQVSRGVPPRAVHRLLDWSDNSTIRWIAEGHIAVGIDDWIDRVGGLVAVCRYMGIN
jgi:hypothetical protein